MALASKSRSLRFTSLSTVAGRLVAALVLLLAAVVALLFAMRFTAIAFDCGFSPFAWLPHIHGAGDRLLLLAAVIAFLVAALSLLSARGPARLKIALPGEGTLEVRFSAIEHTLCSSVEAQGDVERVRIAVRSGGGGPAAQVSVQLSAPRSDLEATRREFAEVVRAAMMRATGQALTAVDVAVTASALPVTAGAPPVSTVAAASAGQPPAPSDDAVAPGSDAPAGDDAGQSPETRGGA